MLIDLFYVLFREILVCSLNENKFIIALRQVCSGHGELLIIQVSHSCWKAYNQVYSEHCISEHYLGDSTMPSINQPKEQNIFNI